MCPSFQEPTSGDGWGSWGDTDGGPVEGSARISEVAARSMGKSPMGPGLAPQQHRCVRRMSLDFTFVSLQHNVG